MKPTNRKEAIQKDIADSKVPSTTPKTREEALLKESLQTLLEKGEAGKELPDVTTEDNGKVLKVIEGEWSKGIDESLPDVTAADNGKVLKVANGEWEVGEETKELPTVTASDNNKVLKVAGGTWTKGTETKELPSFTSNDASRVLRVAYSSMTGEYVVATGIRLQTIAVQITTDENGVAKLSSSYDDKEILSAVITSGSANKPTGIYKIEVGYKQTSSVRETYLTVTVGGTAWANKTMQVSINYSW